MDLEELQEKFTQYGKQLSEGDSEEKLIATACLLRAISEYFEKNAPNTDISGITLLMLAFVPSPHNLAHGRTGINCRREQP